MPPIILLNGSYLGSILNFRATLIRQLAERGYSVHVTAPGVQDEDRAAVAAIGATLHDVPLARRGMNPVHDWRYMRAQRKLIRALRPEMVINYTIKPNIWGSLAAAAEGVPSASMVTGLGYSFVGEAQAKFRAIRLVIRRLYRMATSRNRAVIFQNIDDRNDFVAAGCLQDAGKARIVNGSGVDLTHYREAPLPDTPVFLLIARLLRSKGVEEFIKASRMVRVRHPEARFRVAGFFDEGPDSISEDEFRAWSGDDVEYLGSLKDVRPAIAACSVYVLPSYREGTPRSVLEAMAMGRAIITTDAPGCRETTVDGGNGLLVQVKAVEPLADAMSRLAGDAGLRARMGRASLEIAREKYAVEAVTADLVSKLGL